MDTNKIVPDTTTPQPEAVNNGTTEKYIRTLARDVEVLKGGGTPDLAPFAEPQPSPKERLVAPSPVAPISPPPAFHPEPLQPVVEQVPYPKPEDKPVPLKTYSSDFSNRMKETRASSATVIAAEQDAAQEKKITQTVQKKFSIKNAVYILAGIILISAGGWGVYAVYMRNLNIPPPSTFTPTIPAPIFVEEQEQISGMGSALLLAIQQSVERPLADGTIRLLYTENATTTDNSIFSALQLPAPNILLRNLNAANSMAGVINIAGEQSPFFILSVDSYGDTFSGMLSWEPVMLRDLSSLFPLRSSFTSIESLASSTLATSTPKVSTTSSSVASTSPAFTTSIYIGFHDEIVRNHDARVYRDYTGKDTLAYGYWNQQTLVIARDEVAFAEILDRLASSHVRQ